MDRHSIAGLRAALLLAVALIATAAQADPAADLAQARADLLGGRSRQWVKERVVVSMGSDKHCTAGETYNFHNNGSVDIALCADHVLTRRKVPWTLQAAPPLDVNLVFDGRSYLLSFAGTQRALQMRWRDLGQIKPRPTTDVYLGISKD
jgi:hypothetical protein